MDNRVRQKIEDWENNSQKKNARSPPPGQSGKSSRFTYTYTDDVSIYDRGIQTEMRRSKVKDTNVQVEFEKRDGDQ